MRQAAAKLQSTRGSPGSGARDNGGSMSATSIGYVGRREAAVTTVIALEGQSNLAEVAEASRATGRFG
jgi:hypothetical protein